MLFCLQIGGMQWRYFRQDLDKKWQCWFSFRNHAHVDILTRRQLIGRHTSSSMVICQHITHISDYDVNIEENNIQKIIFRYMCFSFVTISFHTHHDENRTNARVIWHASSPSMATVQ